MNCITYGNCDIVIIECIHPIFWNLMISMFKLFLDSAIEIDLELVLRGVKNKMG